MWRVIAVGVVACGRIGFDPDVTCNNGVCCQDHVCMPVCGDVGQICAARCGDGVCDGAAGETCASCPADCATPAAVCGNGWCDDGEDPTSCSADCGPSPWPWADEEVTLLALVNQTRAAGTTCGVGTTTTTPLALDASRQEIMHAWAWMEASGELAPITGATCSGTSNDLLSRAGYFYTLSLAGPRTAQDAFDYWMSDAQSCSWLMGASTMAGVAVAHGQSDTYVVGVQ